MTTKKTDQQIQDSLVKMNFHESKMFEVTNNNSPVKHLLVTRVIGGWIYIIDYGTTSEPPIFVPIP